MHLVKAVVPGVGETLFLRYNLLGEAQKVYEDFKTRQLYHNALTEHRPPVTEYTDDYGMHVLVPSSLLIVQMIALDKNADGDARQQLKGQMALQREAARIQGSPAIVTPPAGMDFRQ